MATMTLLAVSAGISAQTAKERPKLSGAMGKAVQTATDAKARGDVNKVVDAAESLEESRDAGLLTDWHIEGRFGRGDGSDFARKFEPEKAALKQAGELAPRRLRHRRYELVFPQGRFGLPPELDSLKGVFYADSSTYLFGDGEWNVYLESRAEAVVFVDGRQLLARSPAATGAVRAHVHLESGSHLVMVKFTAQAAPFLVAILPLNSESRRKNNTPYLQASPESEEMLARAMTCGRKVLSASAY